MLVEEEHCGGGGGGGGGERERAVCSMERRRRRRKDDMEAIEFVSVSACESTDTESHRLCLPIRAPYHVVRNDRQKERERKLSR